VRRPMSSADPALVDAARVDAKRLLPELDEGNW
jgi:hypothetical protein